MLPGLMGGAGMGFRSGTAGGGGGGGVALNTLGYGSVVAGSSAINTTTINSAAVGDRVILLVHGSDLITGVTVGGADTGNYTKVTDVNSGQGSLALYERVLTGVISSGLALGVTFPSASYAKSFAAWVLPGGAARLAFDETFTSNNSTEEQTIALTIASGGAHIVSVGAVNKSTDISPSGAQTIVYEPTAFGNTAALYLTEIVTVTNPSITYEWADVGDLYSSAIIAAYPDG